MNTVLIIKALHVSFMVAWFAGLFYLPRLFVYHADNKDPAVDVQFKVMERRLLYFVSPFALLTLVFGVWLIYLYGATWFAASSWLHYKLALVSLLYVYHGYCFKLLNDFKLGKNSKSSKFYRFFNEFPVLLLFAIVFLAILKPL
ncbi:CopD family protein [Rheinheimera mesophila]|uniref:Protoporphyrinogen IX oxidase n=1 Tax=Rheinheimera mesophila TaxID=1547515 RepID=A0A3P3QT45_9GAMM|nr:CopD family protein [Rheinheimera mesophila]KKL03364.1 membrane protein [Rheinheimera mesophila]RRJ23669.1 CopD family protein [Rheinheimera mesophila]